MTEYRHEADYLADQLRQYIDHTLDEMADHMRAGVNGYAGLAELLGLEPVEGKRTEQVA